VPTSNHVQLSYGLTPADWAGRGITLAGVVGLVFLGLWNGARRFAAGGDDAPADDPDGNGRDGNGDGAARDIPVDGSGDEHAVLRDGDQPDDESPDDSGREDEDVGPPPEPPPGWPEEEPPGRTEPVPALP
jgi:hypothetical protein